MDFTATGTSYIVETIADLIKTLIQAPNSFEISGDLANKIFKIKSEGLISWGALILLVGIAYGIFKIMVNKNKNESKPDINPEDIQYSAKFAAKGITKAQFPIVMTAVSLCSSFGDIGILNKLGQYDIAESSNNYVKLVKKSK